MRNSNKAVVSDDRRGIVTQLPFSIEVFDPVS